MPNALKITSIQAQNADFIIEQITGYIGKSLGIPTEFILDIPWQARERQLDAGYIDIGWICGLPYIWKIDQENPHIELLAAPVMRADRYQNRPIYFSDVVVHRDSDFYTFSDLRGASWAYNEPHSHSGYNITRYHLASLGETKGYFHKVVEAGAHQNALEMVLKRQIDAAAIDSTVLELELALKPEIKKYFRIIESLGPSPIPPWVIQKSVPIDIRKAIQGSLIKMHTIPEGGAILSRGQIARFVIVQDTDYNPIREMAKTADSIEF